MTWRIDWKASDSSVRRAQEIAKHRTKTFGNDQGNDLIGALGEVAVSRWAHSTGLLCDDAYSDPTRYREADVVLGAGRRFDVKTCAAGARWRFPQAQVDRIEAKADGVIWCEVIEATENWDVVSYAVTVLGWTRSSAIVVAPTCRDNENLRAIPDGDVLSLDALRAFVVAGE